MAEQTNESGGSPRPTDGPVPRDPLKEIGNALISMLHTDDISDEASTEPLPIDAAGQKKIYTIFAPEEGRALFPTAAGQERARKDAWLLMTDDELEAMLICISRALEIHEALKSASASDAVRVTLSGLIKLLAKEHLDYLRRRISASFSQSTTTTADAEDEAKPAPTDTSELFSVDKLTGNQSCLHLLNAAVTSSSWGYVENYHIAVKNGDIEAEHHFDNLWLSLDNMPATEDQLTIVTTLLATWEGSAISSEEKKNLPLMVARKRVGGVCLTVAKAMISKSIRGYSEFLSHLHFEESIRRVWEQEPAALMVMKLQKPDGIIKVLTNELHLFHPLQQFASNPENKLSATTAADVVIKCLMGFAAFAYGTLSTRLGDDFDANVCRLINTISLHNENCKIMPDGAMGIVLTIIVPAIKIRFTDVFKRRCALSFLQDSVSGLPGPISNCLTLVTLPPEIKFQFEMTIQRLNFLVSSGGNTWSMTIQDFWGNSPQGALFGFGAGKAIADYDTARNGAGAADDGARGSSRQTGKIRICRNWAKHGNCRWGKNCRYLSSHTKEVRDAALASKSEKDRAPKDEKDLAQRRPRKRRKSASRSRSRSRSKSPVARGEATLTQRRLQGSFDAFCKKQDLQQGQCVSKLAMARGCQVQGCTLSGCRPRSRTSCPDQALVKFFTDERAGGGRVNVAYRANKLHGTVRDSIREQIKKGSK